MFQRLRKKRSSRSSQVKRRMGETVNGRVGVSGRSGQSRHSGTGVNAATAKGRQFKDAYLSPLGPLRPLSPIRRHCPIAPRPVAVSPVRSFASRLTAPGSEMEPPWPSPA
jgi:hypothetical protein